MTMTRKQLKAINRRKAIRKKRNVRTNNMSINPWRDDSTPFMPAERKQIRPGVLYI